MESLKISCTTDVHGYLNKSLENLKDLGIDLLVDSGDFFIGSPITFYSYLNQKENPLVKVANKIGYDIMVPGNHDLDFGIDYLKNTVKKFKGEYICGNLVDEYENLIFKPHVILEKKGLKIGVVGLLTGGFSMITGKYFPQDVYVKDPESELRKILKEIKNQVDFIVVAYHGGATIDPVSKKRWFYPSLEDQAGELIIKFPEVNSFIYGHQHFTNSFICCKTAAIQPGSYGNFIGEQSFNTKNLSIEKNHIRKLNKIPWEVNDENYNNWLNSPAPIEEFIEYIKSTYKADEYKLEFKSKTIKEFSEEVEIPFTLGVYTLPKGKTILATPKIIESKYLKKNIIDTFFGNYLIWEYIR